MWYSRVLDTRWNGLQNCLALQFDCHKTWWQCLHSVANPVHKYYRLNYSLAFPYFVQIKGSSNGSLTKASWVLAGPGYGRNVKAYGELSSSWSQFNIMLLSKSIGIYFFPLDLKMRIELVPLAYVGNRITSSRCAGRVLCWCYVKLQRFCCLLLNVHFSPFAHLSVFSLGY